MAPSPNIPEQLVLAVGSKWAGVRYADSSGGVEEKALLAINAETNLNRGALTNALAPNFLTGVSNIIAGGTTFNVVPLAFFRRFLLSSNPPVYTSFPYEQFFMIAYCNSGSYPVGSIDGTKGRLVIFSVMRSALSTSGFYPCAMLTPMNWQYYSYPASPYGPFVGGGVYNVSVEEFSGQIFVSFQTSAIGVRIDTNNQVRSWQPAPPQDQPTYALAGTGVLTGQFQYLSTYYGDGFETSPSPLTNTSFLTAANNQILVTLNVASEDLSVLGRNLYRYNAQSGVENFQLVATIDNTVPTYTDNNPDPLTGQNLILRQDPPPPFVSIRAWQNRMWGFGVNYGAYNTAGTAIVYYSLVGKPNAFDIADNAIQIGFGTNTDVAIKLAVVDDLLLCFLSRSVWYIQGYSPATYVSTTLFADIGAYNAASVVEAEQGAFFVSQDFRVFFFNSGGLQYISDDVQDFLYENAASFGAATCAWYKDSVLYVSISASLQTICFNTKQKEWYNSDVTLGVPYSRQNAAYGILEPSGTGFYEIPGASESASLSAVQYQSRESYAPAMEEIKSYTGFLVVGRLSGFTLVFTVDAANLGNTEGNQTYTWSPAAGESDSVKRVNFPRQLIGGRISVLITSQVLTGGANAPVYIRKIEVYGAAVRKVTASE